jgi:hypothetical protein
MSKINKSMLKRIHPSTLLYALLIAGVVAFAVSLVVVYTAVPSNAVVNRLKGVLPYPIVTIGYRDGMTFRTLAQNMTSVKRFYETQDFSKVGLRVDFSTEDGQKRFLVREKEVLNKMLEDKAIEILARDRGITVSRDEATQGVARKLEEYGSGATVKGELMRLYGWSLSDFEEKVVMPSLYQEKLQASFEQETDTASAKEKILGAQQALQAGQSFAEVAKKYSEGETAGEDGELGWFALSDLVPELRALVTTQKIGVPGDIVESGLGFHIVLVEEIKKEDTKQLYRLKQIFIKKTTFADFLTEKMRGMAVHVLSPQYEWDRASARVEFHKQELRDFEKKLYANPDGDAAFLF